METIRLGVIGIGNMGTSHCKNLLAGKCPDFTLVAICDRNHARITWAKENFDAPITYFDNAEAMLDSGLIDACIIAVPHYDHPKYAMACMARGIHVLVEKPAGVYTRQVREMNEFAAKHDVVFAMMFNQRTNPVYIKMRELVQSGKYGQIRRTNWLITNWYRPQFYYDSGDWRATWSGEGGGVLLNQCPHQLDLWQWICGMPKSVHAHIKFGQWHDIEVDDDVTAYVEYENGATGVFITSTGDACGSNRFEIQMDRAKLVVDNDKLTVIEFDVAEPEFTKTCTKAFGHPEYTELDLGEFAKAPAHVGVINAFGGKILRNEPLIAHGSEGINALTLSNAMHLSAWLGKTVELPLDEDLYYNELMKRVATSRRKEAVVSVVADTEGSYGGAK
ncbi:MAG: Gfo/Idh/MocA family oxidoreductase [Ruminococcaceae bacterium]|nr:Gfo/Idh/MocA family oxidoreductase [Oscillospiraceae bacterium]